MSSELFSIGDGPEGVTIWAGGSGGWFEIVPSLVYKEEYENMAAAVKLYYSILDYITEAKRSRKNSLDVGKIFDAVRSIDDYISCNVAETFVYSTRRRNTILRSIEKVLQNFAESMASFCFP